MNSRQYEAMKLEEHAQKEAKKLARAEAKKLASQNKMIRHLKRIDADHLADKYFNNEYDSLKEVKKMVKDSGWTWGEAQKCDHRHIGSFLSPCVNFWLDTKDRARYRRMFKKDIAFMFVRGPLQRVYWYPTIETVIDFIEESAIIFKDPDHMGLTGMDFYKEHFEQNDGNLVEFYVVDFNLDS